MARKVPPIVARSPIVIPDKSRLVTDEWYKWFQQLVEVVESGTTGGGGGGGGGVPDPHAPTHAATGSDPVDVKDLSGYPGGTSRYLRADGTFAIIEADLPQDAGTLLGRGSASGTGPPETIAPGRNIELAGTIIRTTAHLDLPESTPGLAPTDHIRQFATDDRGFTFMDLSDATGRSFRLLRDNLIVAKATQAVTRGQMVYVSGASGANEEVSLARADAESTMPAVGWVVDTVAANAFTRILIMGHLAGINTSAWAEGTRLFVSDTVAGGLTSAPPAADGSLVQRAGLVTRQHASQGEVLVMLTAAHPVRTGMNLDYLGAFASGPVYNDGDIVIADDGIAYMCVVDGTTTPPEPWPGVGIASPIGPPGPQGEKGDKGDPGTPATIVADATYWTVTPHAALVNERALNSLANGYVKSTSGEPSTVSVIPVSEGGTGAVEPTQARANLGVGNVGTLNINGDPNAYLRGDGQWGYLPQQIPAGLVAIFWQACPPGWARVTSWDGLFLRSAATYGATGGATQHQHGPGTLTVANHAHGASGLYGPSHSHGFSMSAGTTNAGDHSHHATLTVNATTGPGNNSTMNTDAGSNAYMSRENHTHIISGNADGNTDSAGTHSHSVSYSGNTSNSGDAGIGGQTAGAAPAVNAGVTDLAPNYPPFVDVVYCYKV